VNIRAAWQAFAEAPDEQARMGQIAGALWIVAALIGAGGAFLPGAHHGPIGWVLALSALVFLYGLASAARLIHWERASIRAHAVGTAVTFLFVGLAVYLMGNSLAYVEPLFVVPLLYAAFFFPRRVAWLLAIELLVIAGVPLLTDPDAIDNAFLPRYVALCVGFLAATWVMVGVRERLGAAERRQREIANTDPLTGVGNRRSFDAAMQRELAARTGEGRGRRASDRTPLALLILDLDDFKGVNDRHGHPAGDAVLREAATRTQAVLRSGDSLARIGGDEFAVIAPGANENGARGLAATIRVALAADARESGLPAPVVSVGWAVYPEDGEDYETLLRAADARMLRIKREGPRALG
jgi:diguanylate cyclase (GGDEF)-like protein